MIAMLKGIVDSVSDGSAVIDVGGVGYLVFCPSGTLSRMVPGEAVSLNIETHVREDHIHLYGFIDPLEREWYRLLTTVQGVGSKVGIAMLSALSVDELNMAIASGDKAQIGRANGVGPKLAARIAIELKDKVAAISLGSVVNSNAKGGGKASHSIAVDITRDAASALVNLGYSPSDAMIAISHASASVGDNANIEALVKGGLAHLGPADHSSDHGGGHGQ